MAVSLEQEVHSLFDRQREDLATRRDIADVRTEIAGVKTQVARLEAAIAEAKADIAKTLVYAIVAMTAIFSAIVKLF